MLSFPRNTNGMAILLIGDVFMLVPFARTLLLYLLIVLAVRFMGKRQVGEMQPAELVITILVSAVAAVPMQDIDIPLAHGVVPVLTLIAAEVLISALSLKSFFLRRLLSGKPVPVIRDGVIDRKAMVKLRLSLDDLFEDLRLNGVFDLRQVKFAQLETNGQLSLLLNTADAPATPRQLHCRATPEEPFYTVISDGVLITDALTQIEKSEAWLHRILQANGIGKVADVFLFCANVSGNTIVLKKED